MIDLRINPLHYGILRFLQQLRQAPGGSAVRARMADNGPYLLVPRSQGDFSTEARSALEIQDMLREQTGKTYPLRVLGWQSSKMQFDEKIVVLEMPDRLPELQLDPSQMLTFRGKSYLNPTVFRFPERDIKEVGNLEPGRDDVINLFRIRQPLELDLDANGSGLFFILEAIQRKFIYKSRRQSFTGIGVSIMVGALALDRYAFTGQEARCVFRSLSRDYADYVTNVAPFYEESAIRESKFFEVRVNSLGREHRERFFNRYPYLFSHAIFAIAKGIESEHFC